MGHLRILLVSPYDLTHPGGVTSHVFDLAHQFHISGHEVQIAGPAGNGRLPQNGYTHHLGHTFKVLSPGDSARVNLSPMIIRGVHSFLEGRQFDVVHLHEPFLPFIGPAFLHMAEGVKVGTFHTWREGPHMPYILAWPFLRYLNLKLQGRVAVSAAAQKTIRAYVPGDFKIIPNGVEFGRFAHPVPPPAHLADDRPTFLFVGRLEARKGLQYLLNAFKAVQHEAPTARLVIVGEGGLKAELEKLVAELGVRDVIFEGYVTPDCLPAYYQRADVFCSSSTVNESFGITLLEAMASGTATIATTINRSTVGEHEKTGLLVPPKDASALATAMHRLIEDKALAERLGEAAQVRAETFDWPHVAKQLLKLYEGLGA